MKETTLENLKRVKTGKPVKKAKGLKLPPGKDQPKKHRPPSGDSWEKAFNV